jgi:hypothetical protein
MKKLLLILSLISPVLYAMEGSADPVAQVGTQNTESNAALIAFVAKFKALHTVAVKEYAAVEQLFNKGVHTFNAVYENLEPFETSTNHALQSQVSQIKEQIQPLGLQLAAMLEEIQEVNADMTRFNALTVQESTYQELTYILMNVVDKLQAIKQELEAITQEEETLVGQTRSLSQSIE